MATKVAHPQQTNGVPKAPMNGTAKKTSVAKATAKKPTAAARQTTRQAPRATPVARKASSVAGGDVAAGGVGSAYSIMASRIANRVAEMAEGITFVERPKPQQQFDALDSKKPPRKLEMRLNGGSKDSVAFSAPFLDNTLQKMLHLQNRMLQTTAELSNTEGVEEKIVKEHASQSAELSRIIALICAEKARQGA